MSNLISRLASLQNPKFKRFTIKCEQLSGVLGSDVDSSPVRKVAGEKDEQSLCKQLLKGVNKGRNEEHVSNRVAKKTEEISKSTEVGKEEYTPTNNGNTSYRVDTESGYNVHSKNEQEERDRLIAERLSREYKMESKLKLTALLFKGSEGAY